MSNLEDRPQLGDHRPRKRAIPMPGAFRVTTLYTACENGDPRALPSFVVEAQELECRMRRNGELSEDWERVKKAYLTNLEVRAILLGGAADELTIDVSTGDLSATADYKREPRRGQPEDLGNGAYRSITEWTEVNHGIVPQGAIQRSTPHLDKYRERKK